MSAITMASIIDKAEIILQDLTNTRWEAQELLDWGNDGQREIVKLKPETSVANLDAFELLGGTKQALPSGTGDDPAGIVLIDVPRNTAETSDKRVVRLIPRRILDDQIPGWHAKDASVNIDHFIYDPRDPKHFYVYPPAPEPTDLVPAAEVELVYSSSPRDCALTVDTATIAIDDVYANSLLNYIVYMAYMKDADYASNDARAQNLRTIFLQGLSLKEQAEQANEPQGSR